MTYADFCQFCGSFIHEMLEMRVVRFICSTVTLFLVIRYFRIDIMNLTLVFICFFTIVVLVWIEVMRWRTDTVY